MEVDRRVTDTTLLGVVSSSTSQYLSNAPLSSPLHTSLQLWPEKQPLWPPPPTFPTAQSPNNPNPCALSSAPNVRHLPILSDLQNPKVGPRFSYGGPPP